MIEKVSKEEGNGKLLLNPGMISPPGRYILEGIKKHVRERQGCQLDMEATHLVETQRSSRGWKWEERIEEVGELSLGCASGTDCCFSFLFFGYWQ